MNNEIIEKILDDELAYESALESICARICRDADIKLVLIAGGSCAGKTTTTKKLQALINESGRVAHVISLDDYYRNLDESVYLPDGTRDIESIDSLRVDMIRDNFETLINGEETLLPRFDFMSRSRTDNYRKLTLSEGEVVLIEGLHALDPKLFGKSHDERSVYRIYLYAEAGDNVDCRFIRRLVRDSRHRNATAEQTFSLWDNVKSSERASIEPFRKSADVAINTFFPYERSILNDDAVRLLRTVSEDNPHYESAVKMIETLTLDNLLPDEYVDKNSLLREFM